MRTKLFLALITLAWTFASCGQAAASPIPTVTTWPTHAAVDAATSLSARRHSITWNRTSKHGITQ
jgi:hypothetical protein